MHGKTRYFMCKMPKFAVEIKISTRRDMEFPQDMAFSQDVIFPRDVALDLHTCKILLFT